MTDVTCSFDGCELPYKSHGLCNGHNEQRLKKRPLTAFTPKPHRYFSIDQCLADYTLPSADGCLLWQRTTTKYGHARAGKFGDLHVAVWVHHNGPVPDGLFVRHLCGVPACVNIDHLALGTPQQNSDDMVRHGRSLRGNHPNAKLTPELVRELRGASGTRAEIAERFGISIATVKAIRSGRLWGWLD